MAVVATPKALDYAAIAKAQRDCPSIPTAGYSTPYLQLIPLGLIRVLCNTKKWHLRPVIPLGHHRQARPAPGPKSPGSLPPPCSTFLCLSSRSPTSTWT